MQAICSYGSAGEPVGNHQLYHVNANFGNGNDSVTLGDASVSVTGSVIGGNGMNVFTQNGGTIVPPWTLKNFS